MLVRFLLRTNKTERTRPGVIYCRISIDGNRAGDFSTFISANPKDWNAKGQVITTGTPEALADNDTLAEIRTSIKETYNRLKKQNSVVTAKTLKAAYLGKKAVPFTLKELLDETLKRKTEAGLSANSAKNEKSRRKNVLLFLARQGKDNIQLEEIDELFFDDLEHFLKSELKHKQTHIVRHLRIVKEALKYAKRRKLITDSPALEITFKNGKHEETEFLEVWELEKLEKHSFRSGTLERAKDRFLFMCYTGLSFVDMAQFKPELHLHEDWIIKRRQKSNEAAIVPLFSKAKDLLSKYGGSLPAIENQPLNRFLKEVAEIAGIRKNLTTRVARRTAAQLWLDMGVPEETVSKMLGHAKIETTRQAYAKVRRVRIEKDLKEKGLL